MHHIYDGERGVGRYVGAPRSGEEDVLLTPGNTELVERVNQCVSALRLECNVQVDRSHGAGGRVAQSLPVLRNGTPRVFRAYAIETGFEGRRCEAVEKPRSEDREHRERMVEHNYWRSAKWCSM